jgi:hypothetical protein
MGLYQRRKMAIYSWCAILVILCLSLSMAIYSNYLLKTQIILLNSSSFKVNTVIQLHLTMDEWLQLSQKYRLHLLRLRPKAIGGFDIWIQGQYLDLLNCLENLAKQYPDIRWQKILIENKDSLLTMQLEAGG